MRITSASCGYTPEPLMAPFGFKGGYLSELWQVAARLECQGHTGIGAGIQSVLWSDAAVFAANSQDAGNEMMYQMTRYALTLAKEMDFTTPFDLLEKLFPRVWEYGKKITGNPDLRATFALNALVPVDFAAWQLYGKLNGTEDLLTLLPPEMAAPLTHRQEKLCSIPLVSYGLDTAAVQKLMDDGYFFLKVKIGSDPEKDGDPEKMLAWDMARLTQIHQAAKDRETPYTESGHIPYYLDANGRYDSVDRLKRLLDHADKIGALERIAILEEPFPEEYLADVSHLPVRIAADESAHTAEDAVKRMDLGYKAIALKPIAKTLSMTLKILEAAHKRNIPCFCADLTVNPWMVDLNKNIAGRIAPLPGMKIGVLESNGSQNYVNWQKMNSYHTGSHLWETQPQQGIYTVRDLFYEKSGGLFEAGAYYDTLSKKEMR